MPSLLEPDRAAAVRYGGAIRGPWGTNAVAAGSTQSIPAPPPQRQINEQARIGSEASRAGAATWRVARPRCPGDRHASDPIGTGHLYHLLREQARCLPDVRNGKRTRAGPGLAPAHRAPPLRSARIPCSAGIAVPGDPWAVTEDEPGPRRPSQGAGPRRPFRPIPLLRRSALAEVGRYSQLWRPRSWRTSAAGCRAATAMQGSP